jgi:2'-5' RNA ligase
MATVGDRILVWFVDAPVSGSSFIKKRSSWPLHLTLVPWFTCSDIPSLQDDLQYIARTNSSVLLHVGEYDAFGPDKTTTVNLIQEVVPVTALHSQLLSTILKHKGVLSEGAYVGPTFRPHITCHEPPVGYYVYDDAFLLDSIHMVSLITPDTCEVGPHYDLQTL